MKRISLSSGIFLFLFFQLTVNGISQVLPFCNFMEKDGLPSSIVQCINQDNRGYLWIGTNNGLCCYNGVDFELINKINRLDGNQIFTVFVDKKGNVWVGTDKCGAGYFTPSSFNSLPGLSGIKVYAIIEDKKGRLWFGTSNGLYCYDFGKEIRYTSSDGFNAERIYCFTDEDNGCFHFGTDKGIGRLCNSMISEVLIGAPFNQAKILSILSDSRKNLWIGTKKNLLRWNKGELSVFSKQDGLCDNTITTLTEDSSGNIWIGTWGGANLLSGQRILRFTTRNGLPNNFIYSIFQDREGNMWFGTHGGASRLSSLNIETYSVEEGLHNKMIVDIVQDKRHRYWFGTSEGLSCLENGNFKNYSTRDGLVGEKVNNLMVGQNGDLWISTTMGLSVFSSGSFFNYTIDNGLSGNILFDSIQSDDGTVWIATINGLTRFQNGIFTSPSFNNRLESVINMLEDQKGELWFASRTTLYKYNKKQLTIFSKERLKVHYIKTIFKDSNDKLWLGCKSGLYRYDNESFTHFNTENSNLPDNYCITLLEDDQKRLWIGTSKGFSCFNGKRFINYSAERLGITGRSWLSGIKDHNGKLWFGSAEGLVSFYPPPVKRNLFPPPVYISGVKVMEQDVPPNQTGSFAHNENILRFRFDGLTFTPPGATYKYRMESIDDDWRYTRDRSLFYPFLPPGSYSLKVKAINSDGIESENPATYSFKIHQPFWQTDWFLILIAVSISIFLVQSVRWRVKRANEKAEAKAREAELETKNRQLVMSQRMELMGKLATGTVHDLKNLLAIIVGYSEEISIKQDGDSNKSEEIEVIKKTAGTAVQVAKQILSFSRPKGHAEDVPVDLCRELLEILDTLKVTQPKNIEILTEIPPAPVYFSIHPARFQQVVMNLCLNAFDAMPHGGKICILLAIPDTGKIILKIADSGKTGISDEHITKLFNPLFSTKNDGKGTGLGLFVVKHILDEYNGEIDVHSKPGEGTTFTIVFPAG